MTGNGFTKTCPMTCANWRTHALCTQFPTMWADRMWLYEDAASDDRPDVVLHTTARRVCAECPARAHCLAEATVDSEQFGIRGGFRLRERKLAAELAERDGIVVYSRTGARRMERFLAYLRWLQEHEEIWSTVPQIDRARTKKEKRAACITKPKHRSGKTGIRAHVEEKTTGMIEEEPSGTLLQATLF
ncbi:WhiB family transcriptional regulator [Bifidobacterium pseudolongum]|uniref:WhiB family transcriptional regulator n=1 Tax=Bifidobacterium pseudolongum TaxID=1694 RepID=UPI00101E9C3E|nr:WhiB family transcriptional regulator [Bifidobacterium pseudolongum]RYQ65477.1 hypothetical protein PG2103B_1701 [Bifidobacterium pseudolongum subsp. globosum]